jgi:hypothetical protein
MALRAVSEDDGAPSRYAPRSGMTAPIYAASLATKLTPQRVARRHITLAR